MSDEKRNWKETIRLPHTEFPMRANLANREPEMLERWSKQGLYHQLLAHRADAPTFTLHDGPPYANGSIHHGHALNKILKDIVVKQRTMAGFRATNIPGWDCHGLPIEHKVDGQLGNKKRDMSVVEVRKACRDYAAKYVEIQRDEFKRLMILAEWERPYRTMDYSYEATTIRELGRFMDGGYVYKGLKPVHWSWAAVTALAEAEVEYARYVAPSVYVMFPMPAAPDWLSEAAGGREVNVVIWTTTPWTLPSNLAIALHPDLDYELLALDDARAIVIATGRKEAVYGDCKLEELTSLVSFTGEKLVGRPDGEFPGLAARHPFIDRDSILLPADYVTLDQGTGCVHTAPGHGADDFVTGRKYGLGVLAPVNKYGKFTAEVPDYEGMHVFAANPLIAQRLFDTGRLLNSPTDTYVVERYPHCWRTNKPLIFRATEQWFIAVDNNDLRKRALDEVAKTTWIPSWGQNRIGGMLEGRPDWCISRQRAWGVPITAFKCRSCGHDVIDGAIAAFVADLAEEHGSDVWFEREAPGLCPEGTTCSSCGAGPDKFTKVKDILDVWFDSGVSWAAVLRDREGMDRVADLYLEGSDQHRGWFQTSLLCGVGTDGAAPYRAVLTHGFVVDKDGHKYSKSSPNYEPLSKMLDVYGAEVLRLWVAAVDYRNDMVLTPALMKQVGDAYRKIRNTLRFLIGNIGELDADATRIDIDALTDLDHWALTRTKTFVDTVSAAYEAYEFHVVFHETLDFCNQQLSAVYLDVLKDRIYCDHPDDALPRNSRAVLYEIARVLIAWVAPILSFTADEAWGILPRRSDDPDNVFFLDLPAAPDSWTNVAATERFDAWLALRDQVNEAVEARRPKKRGERLPGQIGSSQEAAVTLTVPPDLHASLVGHESALAETFITSSVELVKGELNVVVEPSTDTKCARCWNCRPTIGLHAEYPELCTRCADVIERLDKVVP